jgi:hypothetical protein
LRYGCLQRTEKEDKGSGVLATDGLSLLGFMTEQQAIAYLRNAQPAILPPPDDAVLRAGWAAAVANRGAPIARAGNPDIQPIPTGGSQHVTDLTRQTWIAGTLQGPYLGATFQMIEIEPLLAFQFAVDLDRSRHHCGALSKPPTLDELLSLCLPLNPPNEGIQISQGPQSAVIRSRSLNIQTQVQGLQGNFVGIYFGISLPLVQVVRYNGKCYLHNGFHRAYGAAKAGATYLPCIFRDVATPEAAAIKDDGSTFSLALLESADPPTLGHFIEDRAYPIKLRAVARIITVHWADHVVPEE